MRTVSDAYREKLAEARHNIEEGGKEVAALLAQPANDHPYPNYSAIHDLLDRIEHQRSTITWLEDALSYEGFPR